MKKLALLALLPCCLFGSIESRLTEKIQDCRDVCEKIQFYYEEDVHLYYYLLGLETGYVDCLKLILEEK